jgi:putative acetyltransferase
MFTETKAVRNAARQLVRELQLLDGRYCIEGFTFSECHLVTELQDMGEATASELSERLVLEKSTMSRLCNGLIKRGIITSTKDKSDGRRRLLRLTRKGISGANRVHKHSQKQVESALTFMNESDRSVLAEAMHRYSRGLRYTRLSNDYLIRPIRKSDNPRVARIIRDVMTEYGAVGEGYSINDPEVDNMYESYPTGDSSFFVITLDDKVLGCGGIGPLSGADGKTCELRKMYFVNEMRGTGMGTKLLNLCMDEARRLGYETCYLETLDHMTHARHLYRKHGFETLDKPMGATGHSACNAWMAKSL